MRGQNKLSCFAISMKHCFPDFSYVVSLFEVGGHIKAPLPGVLKFK